MAGQRYSRILDSARYYGAISHYIDHIKGVTTRTSRIGKGDPRPESQKLYVVPFGKALATGQMVRVSAAKPSWTNYSNRFTGRTVAAAPTDESKIVLLEGFKPARISIRTGMSAQAVEKKSQVTGLAYGSYGGKSTSVPFGRKDANDQMTDAFLEIETAIGAGLSGNFQVSLIREKVAL